MNDDIVRDILERVMSIHPAFTQEHAIQIELQVRRDWGGVETYIAKTRPVSEESKQRAIDEARRTGRVVEAADRNGISRRTMYRLLKR